MLLKIRNLFFFFTLPEALAGLLQCQLSLGGLGHGTTWGLSVRVCVMSVFNLAGSGMASLSESRISVITSTFQHA